MSQLLSGAARLLLVLLICSVSVPAGAQGLDGALLQLRRSAQAVADASGAGAGAWPELEARSQQLLEAIGELEDRLSPGTVPPTGEYVLTLLSDARVLAGAVPVNRRTSLVAVDDIYGDIRVKLAAARAGLGIAATSGVSVRVSVNTMRGKDSVDGFIVHANSIRYPDAAPMFPFGNPSSPARRQLAPGRYVVVASKSGSPDLQQVFDIGADGEDSASLTLIVP